MAGRRRKANKPFRAESRAEGRRRMFTDRVGRAQTPGQRVSLAVDYLTGALFEIPTREATVLAAEAVETLVALAKRAEEIARRRHHSE